MTSIPQQATTGPAAGGHGLGIAAAFGAFATWGISPLYFKAVAEVGAWQLMAHRIVWTQVMLLVLLALTGRLAELRLTLPSRGRLAAYAATTLLVTFNWLMFILAVLQDRLLEASLGYFINPLVNVVLGLLFLDERLTRLQWLAVALATIGVAVQVVGQGTVPWIALGLGISFGFYALVRKKAGIDPVVGLLVETSVTAPIALAFLGWLAWQGAGVFGTGLPMSLLLMVAGPVTAVPLILYMTGARRLSLSTIGILQYLAPSMYFVMAVLLYDEPFTTAHLVTFAAIWIGLAIYSWDVIAVYRRQRPQPVQPLP